MKRKCAECGGKVTKMFWYRVKGVVCLFCKIKSESNKQQSFIIKLKKIYKAAFK